MTDGHHIPNFRYAYGMFLSYLHIVFTLNPRRSDARHPAFLVKHCDSPAISFIQIYIHSFPWLTINVHRGNSQIVSLCLLLAIDVYQFHGLTNCQQ